MVPLFRRNFPGDRFFGSLVFAGSWAEPGCLAAHAHSSLPGSFNLSLCEQLA
jgi:hypothetical protein